MRIVVGMSGGVDSSVAALLLKRAGHEVIGVFMNNWEEEDENGVCTSERDWADVRAVCARIGIPYYSVNFAKEYYERVFTHFLDEYRRGRTPNPDVLCNREIKFAEFLDFALKLGAQKLATGHFAGIEERADGYHLMCAKDAQKDQTYFLCLLGQRALSHALFPLREYTKAEVREIARKRGLPVSEKKDSTGVCFIGERSFKPFLMHYLPAQPGPIVDVSGKELGRHDGGRAHRPGLLHAGPAARAGNWRRRRRTALVRGGKRSAEQPPGGGAGRGFAPALLAGRAREPCALGAASCRAALCLSGAPAAPPAAARRGSAARERRRRMAFALCRAAARGHTRPVRRVLPPGRMPGRGDD